ncbi:MAG: hypothetical protein OXR68_02905 [Alphaproteobacteria bacterium]|nr:hypothetical protein [Alphaproteobacteria bacterium]MDD9919553.1 hypothetical protein [Alphaproteobacteria bacterium]
MSIFRKSTLEHTLWSTTGLESLVLCFNKENHLVLSFSGCGEIVSDFETFQDALAKAAPENGGTAELVFADDRQTEMKITIENQTIEGRKVQVISFKVSQLERDGDDERKYSIYTFTYFEFDIARNALLIIAAKACFD